MSWTVWGALAAAFAISALPSPVAVRADDLAARGRLVASSRGRRWRRVPRVSPARSAVVVATAAAAALVSLVAWRGGPALAGTAAAVLAVVALFGRDLVRRRRGRRSHQDRLIALQVLVGELEAGTPFAGALAAAAAVGGTAAAVLGRAAELAERGDDPAPVLASGGEELRGVAAAWRVSGAAGAAPAALLDRVVRDAGAADDRRRAVTVALAGPRSSALVLSGLPVVGLALGLAMGADPVAFLLHQPAGRLLGAGGVLLDLAGLLWIRSLVRGAER